MKNIIIGNGVNIQFDGWDYTNKSIIKRALTILESGVYSKDVYTEEIEVWLKLLYREFPNFLKGDYDKLAVFENEKKEIKSLKQQYSRKTKIYEIGFEDFFLLSELHCRKNKIGNPEKYYFREFLRRVFLDSIFNKGLINQIHKNFSSKFIEYIKSFDNIFTTNYDRNIELATNSEVLYLHGAFHILDSVYDKKSFRNLLPDKPVENAPVISGYEHVFSTALTDSSGENKQSSAESSELANIALDKFVNGIKEKPELKKEIEKWKNVDNDIVKNFHDAIKLRTSNPNIKFSVDYALNKLKKINGAVSIIGLSPYNDSHILSTIVNNRKIKNIEYFYYGKSEKNKILSYNKKIETLDVREFWAKTTSP